MARSWGIVVALMLPAGCGEEPRTEVFDLSTSSTTGDVDASSSSSSSTSTGAESGSSGETTGSGGSSSDGSSSSSTGEPMNCGDGTIDPGDVCFRPDTTVFAMGTGARDLSIADFDVDGALDLLTLDVDALAVHLRRGDGDGGFAEPETWSVTAGAFRLAHGDFDYDGDPDFVVFGQDLTVFYNATGSFAPFDLLSAGVLTDDLTDGIVGEFDDQLGLDIVHTTQSSAYFQRGTVGPSGWEFGQIYGVPVIGEGASGVASMAFAFDGDAIEDLIMLNREVREAQLLLANGGGGFQIGGDITVCPVNSGAYRVAIGDIDGDGEPDLVVTCTSGAWTLLLGEGDGLFGDPIIYLFDTAFRPAIADIDHDGDNDVIVGAAGLGEVGLFLYERTGLVIYDSSLLVAGSVWAFGIADLDEDNALDIAVAVTTETEGSVEIFWGDP